MKKKILVCAFIAICLSIAAYSTTAYLTYENTATNVITMGNVKIELQELAIPPDGGEPVAFADAIDVLPGESVSKIVQIKNLCENEAWIRISLEKAIELAREGESDASLVGYNINAEKWQEKDGYYYYLEALLPGETTAPLFTEVCFDAEMGNMYQESKARIKVVAEATQKANNGKTVFEAAGWPEKLAD